MIGTKPNQTEEYLYWKKWSIVFFVFISGYITYYWTDGKCGFFPELLHHIGLFLAAVVAVHFIYDLFIKKNEREAMHQEVKEVVATTINAFMPSFEKWGFQGFEENLDYKVIFEALCVGDELLWFDTYAPSRFEVLKHLTEALAKGVKIKMLVINPKSNVAILRAKEIDQTGLSEKTFLNDLKSFILELSNIKNNTGSLEVKLYDDLPCVPMYIHRRNNIPIRGFTSYFLSRASERFAHARWGFAENGMLKYFTVYFDNKWLYAKPIEKPIDWNKFMYPPQTNTLKPSPTSPTKP